MDQYQRVPENPPPPENAMQQLAMRFGQIFQREEMPDRMIISANSGSKYKKPAFMVDQMESTFLDMKKSFDYVGDNSTFQQRITWIFVIQWISFSFMVNSMAYFFRTPNFVCKLVPLTDIFIPCTQAIACRLDPDSWKVLEETGSFFQVSQTSIVEQFQLYCDKSEWISFTQSMFFVGGFISGYIFSMLSERLGRRVVLMILLGSSIISMVVCAAAPDYTVFMIAYFFVGFSLFGYQTNVYIYIADISALRFRTISINMLTMVWAGTPIFLPFLGLLPTWRVSFYIFAGIWGVTAPLACRFFLQSPRFLLSKKCYSQVREIFEKISVTNKRPPYKFRLTQELQQFNETFLKYSAIQPAKITDARSSIQTVAVRTYNYLDLFRYPSLKKPTFVLMYWWMFRFFLYFGLNLALQSVLQSGFILTVSISIAAFAQVAGSLGTSMLSVFFCEMKRLQIMKMCLFSISICLGLMWFTEINSQCQVFQEKNIFCIQIAAMILLVIAIKFFSSVFFSGLIVYYSQVYPTPVRSLGCGFTLTFGRLGTIIVPIYINRMKVIIPDKNSLCFLFPFGVLAYLFTFIMPNTQQVGMRETIVEQEEQNNIIQMKDIVGGRPITVYKGGMM